MQVAKLINDVYDASVGNMSTGTEVQVEGLWKDLTGGSWMHASGNFAAMNYGMRSGLAGLPFDDNVYYGKVNGLGFIFHESELEFATND